MKIYVCIKRVPSSAVSITIIGKNINENISHQINPYDENAITEAVQFKKQNLMSEVIAVTVGNVRAEETLRSAMAMGVDRSIHVITEKYLDSCLVAIALKKAILLDGKPTIIFTGKESIDAEGLETMFRLAKELDFPVATDVTYLEKKDHSVLVHSQTHPNEKEVMELSLPCIVATGKMNHPKYPTLPEVARSKKKIIKVIPYDDLISPELHSLIPRLEVLELRPINEERQSQELTGNPEEIVEQLKNILQKQAKVI